ncbi:MAG: nitrilase-related carbon-nitrogen hydrolase [Rickettsiales bacterium]
MENNISLKVASANLNQTIANFTRNVPNIEAAIDKAVEDGADVLSLQELVLTGYSGDDYFKWIRNDAQQKELLGLVQHIADYAAAKGEKGRNLVISVGFPFFYADKSQPVKTNVGTPDRPVMVDNPLYNLSDYPFNAVATLSGGEIHAIDAKSVQPDGAAEYEGRQFTKWPDYLGAKEVTFPDPKNPEKMKTVPFGKVVVQLGEGEKRVTLYHEICAEGWLGIKDDGSINDKEMREGRYLHQVANDNDISLVINPSTSKPEPFINKPDLRKTLCETGSKITGGAYVYTNSLGLEATPSAFEGGSIYAQNGEMQHRSERYSLEEVVYSSAVMDVPVPQKSAPHVVIPHQFNEQQKGAVVGAPAPWEEATGSGREAEEVVRNTALWIRDYLKKSEMQGLVISLSGGADSAFGAVCISQAIDLNIRQLEQQLGNRDEAVAAFINLFPHLKYRDDVLAEVKNAGADAAIALMKKNMLTCIYLPSDNSGITTEDAARTLVEGGQVVSVQLNDGTQTTVVFNPDNGDTLTAGTLHKIQNNGKPAIDYKALGAPVQTKGIGGKFEVVNVQASVDSFIEAYAGLVHKDVLGKEIDNPDHLSLVERVKNRLSGIKIDDPQHKGKKVNLLVRAQQEIREYVAGKRTDFSPAVEDALKQKSPGRRLSWSNPEDDITLQNIQARARQPYPWMFANKEHKIACVTSNWSEAVAGYWTFGGDGHMGAINLCGGVPKSKLRNILKYLEHKGLQGLEPVSALNPINVQIPTAELRPTAQSDEADLMPYKMLDAISEEIFFKKKTPADAYHALQLMHDPDDASRLLFATHDDGNKLDNAYLVQCIEKACHMWHRSQFKRVGSVIAPFLGLNVDPHTAVRTTILSDAFKHWRIGLRLDYLREQLGGDAAFTALTGRSFGDMQRAISISAAKRTELLDAKLDQLQATLANDNFGKTIMARTA